MPYSLVENIYLVNGKSKSCIYDFNSSKLYHIDNETSCIIQSLLGELYENKKLSDYETKIQNELIDNNLVKIVDLVQYEYQDIKNISNESDKINFAWIEVTSKCNLFCKHCYDESNLYRYEKMEFEEFKLVIDILIKIGVKRIQFIGGEPLIMGNKLKQMICYAKTYFDFIEVFTNGTFIDQGWAEFFYDNNIHIAISIYSYIEKEHENVTNVKGSYEKTNNAVKTLNQYNIQYRVCNVILKDIRIGSPNTDLYKLSYKKDIVRLSGRAKMNLLTKELIKRKLITKETFPVPINLNLSKNLINGHNCFGHKLYIAADYKVYPCVMERRISYGNAIKNSDNVINLIKKQPVLIKKDDINSCGICEFRYTCFDCRPNVISADIYEKPWYCTYHPESGQWEDEENIIERLINIKLSSFFNNSTFQPFVTT